MFNILSHLKNIGPGAMVSAAFIGPGTITTCIKAGIDNGYTLLWALLFSTISCIIIQEMSSRLGVVTQMGLSENIKRRIKHPILKFISISMVVGAILFGNSAFETGNITGCLMGVNIITQEFSYNHIIIILTSTLASCLLLMGSYKKIETFLAWCVFLMAILFLMSAKISLPDLSLLIKGLCCPSLGENGLMTAVGLIGTTIGPYGLFLHASSAAKKWHNKDDYKKSRIDTIISISLGGIISMCIVITAAASFQGTDLQINSTQEFADALESVWGSSSKWIMGIGLYLAGFSSMITASLGAAFAISGFFNFAGDIKDIKFITIYLFVIVIGSLMAIFLGRSPIELIILAQVANAIILPLIIFFVGYCINGNDIGKYKNTIFNNIFAIIVFLSCLYASYKILSNFFNSLLDLMH